jgi:hypothetical protein
LKIQDVIFAAKRSVDSVVGRKYLPLGVLGIRQSYEKGYRQVDKSHDPESVPCLAGHGGLLSQVFQSLTSVSVPARAGFHLWAARSP